MNKITNKIKMKKYISAAMAVATVASLAIGFSAFAQTPPTTAPGAQRSAWMNHRGGMGMRGGPSIVGTVSAINGNTITVTGKQGFGGTTTAAATTFTVDATNAKVTKAGATITVANIAVGDTIIVRGTISGSSVTATSIMDGLPQANGVAGKVTAISGTTLTVTGRNNTTYTVNASDATVTKAGATSSVSSIVVGDMIFAQGTVNGTSITATSIRDGMMQGPGNKTGQPNPGASPVIGNGQPVVAGKVTAISGETISITNNSNVSYTIDASSAKILAGQNTAISLSSIAVGDSVVIQGTVNGNSITASTVIDQTQPATGNGTSAPSKAHAGFFGGIGQFFSHLFGF